MNASDRPWEWRPSAFANAMIATMLQLPLVHRLMSNQILLLNFTGHKSGKRYSVPVGYVREGAKVTILTKRIRTWWHNFQAAAPVEVRIEGKVYQGNARVVTDVSSVAPLLTALMIKYPHYAQFYGVRLVSGGRPDGEDIRRVAPKIVVVEVALAR
jgi:deazaflavin-dependent oxidoreductase (nitroreductase family)